MPGTNKTTNLIQQLRSLNIAKDRNKFIQETARKKLKDKKKKDSSRRCSLARHNEK